MRTISATADLNVSAQRVWDLYADVEGSVEWVPFMEEVVYISGPAGLGQVYRERTRLGGVTGISEWVVTEWDPPRRQVQRSIAFRMESLMAIEVADHARGGSTVRQSVELRSQLPWVLGWLHERIFGIVAGGGIEQAVAAAKLKLEGNGTVVAAP